MGTVVTLFLGLAAMIVVYAWLGQGGPVSGLIIFGVLLCGVIAKLASSTLSD